MNSYEEFLASKVIEDPATGLEQDVVLSEHLYDFQRDIVRWALRRGRGAIFADCGLGKTLIQLEWARHVSGDVLILAPLAVAQQTVEEGAKFDVDVTLCRNGNDVRPGINVTNYQRIHLFDTSRFRGVVLDESSILKNFDGVTRNQLTEAFAATPFRLAATATPAPNDYMELGNHAEFLGVMSHVEMLATFFVHDSSDTHKWRLRRHGRAKFWEWLASWAVLLRKPSDLGYDDRRFVLPKLTISRNSIRAGSISDDNLTLFEMSAVTMQERRAARRTSIAERADYAKSVIEATPDEPWVVWCDLNAESEAIRSRLNGRALEIRGSDTIEHKESCLFEFAHTDKKVLVTKPSIAGHGLNWQHCCHMLFLGLSDSWEAWYQAVRRCWRFGQTHPVTAHVITADIEGNVVSNIERKERQAARMFDAAVKHTAVAVRDHLRGATARMTIEYEQQRETGDGWVLELGDSVEVIKGIDSDTVGLSVFSPPFADLYTYSASERDMGNSKTQSQFLEHMGFIVGELLRITMPGRHACVHCMNLPSTKIRDGTIGLKDFRGDLIRLFVGRGWVYHSEVVIWKDPVTAMQRTKAIGLLYKQLRKDSSMSRQGIPDTVLVFRKPGDNPEPITHSFESFPLDLWQKWASPIWMDVNQQDTLNYRVARASKDEKHIAPLQLEVIRRLVRLWSNENDLVFSPFAGIGSEGYVAVQEGRRFMGIELKRSYFDVACENLGSATAQVTLAI
jgi:hypothetical protein